MTMSITFISFQGLKVPIIDFNPYHNISIQTISFMKDTLLPKSVVLIQVAPGQAFTAQIYVSITIGMIICLPIILREILAFIAPALYLNERITIMEFFFPSIILFVLGVTFSYFIALPSTIEFLYRYGESMDVTLFFDINQFITFTVQFLFLFGFSYQLPLIMVLFTKLHIVKPNFWKTSFRYIVLILILFGAFITPDGSGVTMWFVSAPLLGLYLVGIIIIKAKFKVNENNIENITY
jgi:sec-independent protein translocase protein TatC